MKFPPGVFATVPRPLNPTGDYASV